jgi:hypothetical protein
MDGLSSGVDLSDINNDAGREINTSQEAAGSGDADRITKSYDEVK